MDDAALVGGRETGQQAADEAHRRHWHPESDFMAFLNLWQFHEEQRQALGIRVVNLSLGSGNYADSETDTLSDELATLRDLGVFVVAAVVTPPDMISQLTLAIPLVLLYEISIWAIRALERAAAADKARGSSYGIAARSAA